MRRIQRQHIKKDTNEYFICDAICNATNSIRNECIDVVNAHYKKYNSYDVSKGNDYNLKIGYIYSTGNLFHIFKNTDFMYRNLFSSKVTKQVFKDVEQNFKGYRKAIDAYFKSPKKFKGKPQCPKSKSDKGRYVAKFEAEQLVTSLNSGYISIGGKKFILDIPNTLNLKNEQIRSIHEKSGKIKITRLNEIKEISINPTRNGYEILISYEKFDNDVPQKQDNGKYLGIDIGVKCLLSLSCNHLGWTPTMISGDKIKSLTTAYIRETQHYKKLLGKNSRQSCRLDAISFNFTNRKRDYCHKLARQIINMCKENDITKIVIGNNKFWKQGANLGKSTKLFQLIPYDTIISLIKDKAYEEGIEVIVREESYTSKLSFLDMDSFTLKTSPFGKRIHRSIYYSSNYGNIHADINASLNILRKEYGDQIFDLTNIKQYKLSPKYAEIKLN